MSNLIELQTTGEMLIPTIAYGDATGLPFEAKNSEEIMERFAPIDKLHQTTENRLFKGVHDVGTWSDDTQLSIAVAEAQIAADRFDLKEHARQHIKAYHESEPSTYKKWWPRGWGGSTTFSVRRMIDGVSPYDAGEGGEDGKGAGNGVLMKMSPLVYWQKVRGIDHKKSQKEVIDLTRMTHTAPEAVVSSLVHRAVLDALLDLDSDTDRSQLNRLYQQAVTWAQQYEDNSKAVTSEVLRRLERFTIPGITAPLRAGHIIEAAPNNGFYAPETLLMAYGSFLIEPHFPDSVYRAVELGGDTDSIASIVGTMSLFLYGQVEKPHDYDKIQEIDRLERVSRELAQAALRIT